MQIKKIEQKGKKRKKGRKPKQEQENTRKNLEIISIRCRETTRMNMIRLQIRISYTQEDHNVFSIFVCFEHRFCIQEHSRLLAILLTLAKVMQWSLPWMTERLS